MLAVCYLGYHAYLHGALLWALFDEERARLLNRPLFLTFALGYTGYLLVPARGPLAAFGVGPADTGALYPSALETGPLKGVCDALVLQGSSVFDVFPSMHIAITATLLVHDWRHTRRRFWVALLPALGLMLSTIALRYHYAVDVFAGALLAAAVAWWTRVDHRP